MVMVPDITHEAYAVDYALAYVCSAINTHGSFAGDNGKIILNTFKEAMILPARAQRKADSEKKVISRNKINVYSRLLPIYVPTCLLYTSPSPRDQRGSRMPSSA